MDDVLPVMVSTMLSGARDGTSDDSVPVAVRLATTCRADSPEAIAAAVTELVGTFHDRNDAPAESVRMVIFTATPDLRTAKPASAARVAGWTFAQYLCLAEMPTDGDLPLCIRALLIVDRRRGADPLRAIYLNGAQHLRPDVKFD